MASASKWPLAIKKHRYHQPFTPSLSSIAETLPRLGGSSNPQNPPPSPSRPTIILRRATPTTALITTTTTRRRKMPSKGTKAKNMLVHVSGISNKHPIQTGVAYWYRGHYLFGLQGNPVEPVPFATKEIHIIGTTPETAPKYEVQDPMLVEEYEIAALYRSMVHEWENRPKEGVAEAFDAQKEVVESLVEKSGRDGKDAQASQSPTPMVSHPQSVVPAYTVPAHERFYNDRALYLAASAPNSHHGTPFRSNTPYDSRSVSRPVSRPDSPLHGYGEGSAPGSGLRPVASMPRVDQLMIDHGIRRSISTLQEYAPEFLNDHAVAASNGSQSRSASRPASRPPLSRVPSMYMDSDNLSMGQPPVSRPMLRVPIPRSHGPDGFRSASQPGSRALSRVSSVAGMNEGLIPTSLTLSRLPSPAPSNQDTVNECTGSNRTPSPMMYDSSVPANMSEVYRGASLSKLGMQNTTGNFQGTSGSRPSSRLPSRTPSVAGIINESLGNTSASLPPSRPLSRIPSVAANINDDFGTTPGPLPGLTSSMSLLGDDFNGHQSKFFPTATGTGTNAKEVAFHKSASYFPIGSGRPRKDSMAKASQALNEVYKTRAVPGCTFGPSGCAITSVSNSSSDDGGDDGEGGGTGEAKVRVTKCPIHNNGCDGVTVTGVHQTEHMRLTKGLVGSPPFVEGVDERVMVDWMTVLKEVKMEKGL
ncbi:hypothetical protein K458DRAFT_429379 [Lentithecium fluviatile CBS 122367]|uniref:Uncharacterized protein n=1 Tax=Lentithecium fluviatile CBS 122367 TaxID=1168545 RepID=A0A6G1JB66_9PLEO|nr:hypothetical protein K458DRAFT_429379 [Lentithecium fluviatile CBS 122367]